MSDTYPEPDWNADDFAETVHLLNVALDGVDVTTLPDDVHARLLSMMNNAPAAPHLIGLTGTPYPAMSSETLTFRTAWTTDHIHDLLHIVGEHVEAALTDPWLRVGAAQYHRDGSNERLHAWRCHMDQVHTALVALDQLLDATPVALPDTPKGAR